MNKTQLKKLIKTIIKEQVGRNPSRGSLLTPQQEAMVNQEVRNALRDSSLGLTPDQQQKTWMIITGLILVLIGKILGDGVTIGGGSGSGSGGDGGGPDVDLDDIFGHPGGGGM
jgi:hypothetical protein